MYLANVKAAAERASVPVCLHLDHGDSFDLAMRNTPYFDKGRQEQTPEAIRAFLGNAMLCCERFAELAEKKRCRNRDVTAAANT